ncbi:glycosyltransferase family 2 protein [candidate division WOR-3 bacterium]|nr:glycosyltransferase family 2 protein [candidate division WOR-3 bacterium]
MKLIIQIPCYNEEVTLPITFVDLPKEIDGIDEIETLIIDDGSTDRTVEVAKKLGIDHIISFKRNRGLSRAFDAGIEKCLELGADIIVNTDADNQYFGGDIERLVRPIIEGIADVVIGDRQTDKITHFPWLKKKLQKYGSVLVRILSRTNVLDTVSGFRAFSKDAAMCINTLTEFSYTIENLIQLEAQKVKIVSVPVRINKSLRKSRLFKSLPSYLSHQIATELRVYATFKALKVFTVIGLVIILPGLYGFIRFLYYYFTGAGEGHIQSLIFSAAFLMIGFLVFMFGILADLIGNNRKLVEKALYKIKKLELKNKKYED